MTEEDYLADLVSFQSYTENKAESKKCAQYCADFFKNANLHTELLEYNGYPSVVAITQKTKKPKIFLAAHLDVVPGANQLFELTKTKDKLIGRGVYDMKYSCASFMKVINELGEDCNKYDFGVMLTFDEEVGGANGTGKLIENGYSCDVCILPDSGDNWQLQVSSRGGWWFKLKAEGKSAHGSDPENGVNASEILNLAATKILNKRDELKLPSVSLCMTKIFGGNAINQISEYAEATFDMRYEKTENMEKIKSAINEICKNGKIKIETIEELLPTEVDTSNPVIVDFMDITEKVVGKKISTIACKGSTDARYFYEIGVPCIIIQPNGGGRHSSEEWIERGGMEKLTEILTQFIKKYG